MDRYTVDELATATGLPTSTIRLYRQRGLLPPPQREGRNAYYAGRHVEQIGIIGRLKERGYSLASIKEMLDLWREGEPLEAVIEPDPAGPSSIELGELLNLLFPDGEIDQEVLARAAALDLFEMTEEGVQLRDSRDLDIGVQLIRLGVPPGKVLDEYEYLQRLTDDIAIRFADLFETYILRDEPDPPARLQELVRLARSVVDMSLVRSLKNEGERRLGGH